MTIGDGSQTPERCMQVGESTQLWERQPQPDHRLCDFGSYAD
jgi:hypothetical protein